MLGYFRVVRSRLIARRKTLVKGLKHFKICPDDLPGRGEGGGAENERSQISEILGEKCKV